jgi:hypothetical protein
MSLSEAITDQPLDDPIPPPFRERKLENARH